MLMAAFNLVVLGTDDVKILDLLTAYLTATFIVSFQWLLKIGFAPAYTCHDLLKMLRHKFYKSSAV